MSSRGCLLRSLIAIRSPIRLFRPILLVPSWEGQHRPIPERSAILRRHQSPEVRIVRKCLTSTCCHPGVINRRLVSGSMNDISSHDFAAPKSAPSARTLTPKATPLPQQHHCWNCGHSRSPFRTMIRTARASFTASISLLHPETLGIVGELGMRQECHLARCAQAPRQTGYHDGASASGRPRIVAHERA